MNATAPEMYRQGDILFLRRRLLPRGARALGHLVVAEGEQTGHKHQAERGTLFEVENENGQLLYLQNEKPTRVVHEEHNPIRLPAGTWEVRQQREFSDDGDSAGSDEEQEPIEEQPPAGFRYVND